MRRETSDFRTVHQLRVEATLIAEVLGISIEAARGIRGKFDQADLDIVRKPETGRVAPDEGVSGYEKALGLLRNGFPTAREIAEVLGQGWWDGPQGNVWELFDRRHCITKRGIGAEDKHQEEFRIELLERLGLIHGAIVHADGSITPLDKEALDAGVVAVGERPCGYEWTQRPTETVSLELAPGLVVELTPGKRTSDRAAFWAQLLISKILEDGGARQVDDGIDEAGQEALVRLGRDRSEKREMTKRLASSFATRDLVLFDNDADFADETVEALRLCSHPGEGKVTLGWLIDEHADLRQTLSELICDITGGAVSKPNTDLDFVHQCAGQVFVMNLLEEHPALAEDPLFRPVMEQHFDTREISGAVEIARLRLDGNRVVRIGTFGTFNLGKDAA